MIASRGGHVDIVRLLIEAKAQVNIQKEVWSQENTHHNTVLGELTVCFYPQDGSTALHIAAYEGKVDVVRILIETKAQVNTQNKVW